MICTASIPKSYARYWGAASPALFLLAQVFFLREALGHVPRSRPLGLATLAILAVATAPLTLIVGIVASTAVLVAVAIADTVREGDQPPSRAA